jgi:hypothetical protein
MTLEELFRCAFTRHIRKRNGLITAPDALLEDLLSACDRWITAEQREHRIGGCFVRVEALEQLREGLRRP